MKSKTVERLRVFFGKGLWDVGRQDAPPAAIRLACVSQWGWAILREFNEGGLTFRAMSLVYTTLLSLVPLLAVSFSVLKAFGVHNEFEPLLRQMLEPLGSKGDEITGTIIGFVENLKVGVLGSIGLLLLLYTVVSLLEKIEDAFNAIWRIDRSRTALRRFSDYLSVILVGPVLVFSAVGLTASMANVRFVQTIIALEPFGTVYYVVGLVVPYVLLIAAFTFVYAFIPNTRVGLGSALVGGIVAALLWKAAGWLFAVFVVNSTNYDAVYSGFAIVIIFMIWVYVNWLIVLLGGQVSFFHQHPQYVHFRARVLRFSNRLREKLGIAVMYLIGERFYRGEAPWTAAALGARLELPQEPLREILGVLERDGLIVPVAGELQAYLPARDLGAIALSQILRTVRGAGEDLGPRALSIPAVDSLVAEADRAYEALFGPRTLRDVIAGEGGAEPLAPPGPAAGHGVSGQVGIGGAKTGAMGPAR